jgi:hypothetical protein
VRRQLLWLVVALAAGHLGQPQMVRAQNQISFAFALTDPTGELNRNIDTFNGPSLTYLRDVGSSGRWALGATGVGGAYGAADRPVPIPGFHARTESGIAFFLGVLQLKAATGAVQPYVQAAAGYGSFSTTTWVGCDDCGDRIGLITDHGDGTFVVGGSGGLLMQVYRRKPRPSVGAVASTLASDREGLRVYVDLAARYLNGGKAQYLPGDPAITDDGIIETATVESSLQALQYQIGVSVAF